MRLKPSTTSKAEFKSFSKLGIGTYYEGPLIIIENNLDGFIEPRGFKRKVSDLPNKQQPETIPKAEKSAQRKITQVPKKQSGATEIRSSRQQQAQCKARTEAANFKQCCFIEHCADFGPLDYIKALEALLGNGSVYELMKMSGQIMVGLSSVEKAEHLVEEDLTIGNTLLRTYPYRKKAEKIAIDHLPFVVKDDEALRPYCKVVSITQPLKLMDGYSWTSGRREAFVFLNEDLKINQLPARIEIGCYDQRQSSRELRRFSAKPH
ncbi:hypothetical protein LAZ67_X000472 [Cordylochernes scorpioides]|uniref:Uncharacterized protein n=1 Tax=Cordylochernes scorpioides TaxID=51811 RepID=A0ABY6LRT3_9ARAC|nr:hypothetical protein LAZ67_X000472 [Cordylochernes scorpioides]